MRHLLLALNFNNDKFLNDFLDSVLMQNLNQWDVLVIDDASTDDSLKILHAHQLLKIDNVELICNAVNLGINNSIKNILGKRGAGQGFVKLIATDDVLAAGALEVLANVDPTNDFVYSDGYQIDENGVVFDGYFTVPEKYFSNSCINLARYVNYYPAPTALVRADILNDSLREYVDVINAEDWPILIKLTSGKYKIKKLKFKTVYYRRHSSSLSYSFFDTKSQINLGVKSDVLRILHKNIDSCTNYFIRKIINERIIQIEKKGRVLYRLFHILYLKYKLFELGIIMRRGALGIKDAIKAFIKKTGYKPDVNYEKRAVKFGQYAVNDLTDDTSSLQFIKSAQIRHYIYSIKYDGLISFNSVIDFGCGAGKFSPLFKALNAKRIDGFDPSVSLTRFAKDYHNIYNNISNVNIKYDLIFVNNVLGGLSFEGLCGFTSFCKAKLKDNGLICVIEVPCTDKLIDLTWDATDFEALVKKLDMSVIKEFYFYEKKNRLKGILIQRTK